MKIITIHGITIQWKGGSSNLLDRVAERIFNERDNFTGFADPINGPGFGPQNPGDEKIPPYAKEDLNERIHQPVLKLCTLTFGPITFEVEDLPAEEKK